MEKKRSGRRSKPRLSDEAWKQAFKDGICPVGCDLSRQICDHFTAEKPPVLDGNSRSGKNGTVGTWELFKTLRYLLPGATNSELLVAIRTHGLEQPVKQVQKELGLSNQAYYKLYQGVVEKLRKAKGRLKS